MMQKDILLVVFCACSVFHLAAGEFLGQPCTGDPVCNAGVNPVANSICRVTTPRICICDTKVSEEVAGINNKCRCKPGYKETPGTGVCVVDTKVNLNDDCIIMEQCAAVAESECKDGVCACKGDFISYGNTCRQKIKTLNTVTCEFSMQCPLNSRCQLPMPTDTEKKCICQGPDYIANTAATECLKMVGFNEACVENRQCKTNKCTSNKCACEDRFVYDDFGNECLPLRELNQTCTRSRQCTLSDNLNDRVHCLDVRCQCKPSFTSDFTNKKCNSGAVQNTIALASLLIAAVCSWKL